MKIGKFPRGSKYGCPKAAVECQVNSYDHRLGCCKLVTMPTISLYANRGNK